MQVMHKCTRTQKSLPIVGRYRICMECAPSTSVPGSKNVSSLGQPTPIDICGIDNIDRESSQAWSPDIVPVD